MLQAMWQNFLSLHRPGRPLLMPNPWDAGSAKLLASLGFEALATTIERLHSFQEAGADVLFAPGVRELEDIRELVGSVDRPVNVLVMPGMPTVAELADAGVSRISVGGAFAFAA